MKCFHCDSEVPARHAIRERIGDDEKLFCCTGCAVVARHIHTAGFDAYYQFRDQPAVRVDDERETADWLAYDRPSITAAISTPGDNGTRVLQLSLENLRCAACSWLIQSDFARRDGIVDVSIDIDSRQAQVTYAPAKTKPSTLMSALDRLGYRPVPLADARQADDQESRQMLKRLGVAGIGMMQVMMYAIALYSGQFADMDTATRDFFRLFSLAAATPVILYAGWPFFVNAWRGLRARTLGMDVPVALAIAMAWVASVGAMLRGAEHIYLDSAVMFIFLLTAARWLELRWRKRASTSLTRLGGSLPPIAHRLRDDGELETVSSLELAAGDRVVVASDQRVPVDGTLASGNGRFDESLLTGEAEAVAKQPGDQVIAGSVALDYAVEVVVERTGSATRIAAIQRLMHNARQQRPRIQQLADRLAGAIVLTVLAVASLTFFAWVPHGTEQAIEYTLAVLVVTCPCALSLATPTAISAAMAKLHGRGVLVTRAAALEQINQATLCVLDKTGTLTDRQMTLGEVQTFGMEPAQALALAAAMESHSQHPIASAFTATQAMPEVDQIVSVEGFGLRAKWQRKTLALGRRESDRDGTISLTVDGELVAVFALQQRLAAGAGVALAALPGRKLIASGDAARPVREVAAALGIDTAHSRLLPADKVDLVRAAQAAGERVLFVGDGTNDAPVASVADCSVVVGEASAMASQQGDIVLSRGRLGDIRAIMSVAHQLARTIRVNLIWAASYNLAAVPLAALGYIPPWLAAIGMSASSLLVVSNSARLLMRDRTAGPRQRVLEVQVAT